MIVALIEVSVDIIKLGSVFCNLINKLLFSFFCLVMCVIILSLKNVAFIILYDGQLTLSSHMLRLNHLAILPIDTAPQSFWIDSLLKYIAAR